MLGASLVAQMVKNLPAMCRERRAYNLTYRWNFNINRNEITSETHRHKYQANSYQRKKVQWKDLLEASE